MKPRTLIHVLVYDQGPGRSSKRQWPYREQNTLTNDRSTNQKLTVAKDKAIIGNSRQAKLEGSWSTVA
jgi:hypothetical protein